MADRYENTVADVRKHMMDLEKRVDVLQGTILRVIQIQNNLVDFIFKTSKEAADEMQGVRECDKPGSVPDAVPAYRNPDQGLGS